MLMAYSFSKSSEIHTLKMSYLQLYSCLPGQVSKSYKPVHKN